MAAIVNARCHFIEDRTIWSREKFKREHTHIIQLFRNPAGHSSTGRADDSHDLKAWKVIDDAGMRGARLGGAQMSEMHSNFLINAKGANAADLEDLGEEVRKRVFQQAGITLEWEIMRVGEYSQD